MNGMTTAVRIAVAGLLAAAAMAFVSTAGAATEPYVPFVTDFPKPAASPIPAGPTIASDAGKSGIDWAAVAVGGIGGATIAALLLASAFVFARRARPA